MSWRLGIRHTTTYTYDTEVTASYNEARLVPVTNPSQVAMDARVVTEPPTRQQTYWDYWGTQVTVFDLHVPHSQLEVVATSVVDTSAEVPVPDGVVTWEDLADRDLRDKHVELLGVTDRTAPEDEMVELARAIAAQTTPYGAVLEIAALVRQRVAYVPGSTGVRTNAHEAWRLGQGVCQDIAHVTLSMLRSVGVPARYVSGYLAPKKDAPVGVTVPGESHAWVEAHLGSWWGYDPTNGIPAGERHVVVAHGRDYGDVTPVKGIYSGGGSQSIAVAVEVTRLA
ncbi:MAG: transglutaminase family protein [Mycobacteriales bacterium]|nr:transglutaminase family protein [Mycobacteriales bacterium]